MGPPIGLHPRDPFHLDHKQYSSFISLTDAGGQFFHVLDAPLCGRIGEAGHTVLFQRDSLDLHKDLMHHAVFIGCLQVQIEPGISVGLLPFHLQNRAK